MKFLLLSLVVTAFALGEPSRSQPTVKGPHTQITVVTGKASEPHIPFGLKFTLDPEWHVYWKNPGDSGAAPKFNFSSKEIKSLGWPAPERIRMGDLTNYGYEKEIIFPFSVPLKPGEKHAEVEVDLEWLVCKIECLPGFGKIHAKVTSGNSALSLPKYPLPNPDKSFSLKIEKNTKDDITLKAIPRLSTLTDFDVFPMDGEAFSTHAPRLDVSVNDVTAQLKWATNARRDLTRSGFLVKFRDETGWHAFEAAVDLKAPIDWGDLAKMIFFAFLGGILLNVMPCVFPVLSIKVLSLIREAGSPGAAKRGGIQYFFGVITTFLLLGGVLLFLRAGGEELGWGFHLQSPYFVAAAAFLFILIGLNFLGVFEVGESAMRLGGSLSLLPIFKSSFGTGVLATLTATPCTAPFMGTALGASLLLPSWASLVVFGSLGAGMAAPFVVLCFSPKLLGILPKPGAWMVRLKQLFSIPMFLTALWLIWVVSLQVGATPEVESGPWKKFTTAAVTEAKTQGPVFIDFTAAWCLTCQWNKKSVLETKAVQELFEKNGVQVFRGDWTDLDPEITQALAGYGRNSVPLYVFLPKEGKPVLLSEILSYEKIFNLFPTTTSKESP